ncbi:Serine protein kinase [Halorhabdus sp. SVX81]|uniref:PrkA family serine protein kinase n=1 Tax=Halorhabdus sp. SVX81 TaxID=2978283 RepID=UPI0023DC2589|nr:kinase anchor protein [Halorhabdus sp. SVX81]WEL17338.1 Serine protein kinase [Halorhabdus sp. SVX81]
MSPERSTDGDPGKTRTVAESYVTAADRHLAETYEPPMSLEAYVETILEQPHLAAGASTYLLDAIEAAGTRTVVEEGEERERYCFFDDPYNDGEHAILGNTDVLNGLVEDLRMIAARRGKAEKIIWLAGPTATGKSELKRCLINGLRAYSRTDAGRRYTVEWNASGADSSGGGLTYGDVPESDEEDWLESPVQTHPLATFPREIRTDLLADLNDRLGDHPDVTVETDLDPFSREAYEYLEEQYRRDGIEGLFSAVTDPHHLRVKNYVVDVGQGIGVLHAEDEGTPKERLVGSWMGGMLRELNSRGRKNPQAFSYDGVLSQGNGGLTVVEDAAQHADLLRKLLNVPDERSVKLDRGIEMDIDTQLLIISNPDLEAQLDQHAERGGSDPLKALKRRLDKHRFAYLTTLSLEAELLHRELTGETAVWRADSYADLADRIREPVHVEVREAEGTTDVELAPHAIEAAALYDVVSRLSTADLPDALDLVDKALLFDQGYLEEGDERIDAAEFAFEENAEDGERGIPVTYTRDVIADLLYADRDRHHPDLDVGSVIMPRDVLEAMAEGLSVAPVFGESEVETFEERVNQVRTHVSSRQEEDVLAAMLKEKRVERETVAEYVEAVYAWATDGRVENDRGEEVPPDPLTMRVFEVEHLGRFDESHYDGDQPGEAVRAFRNDKIVTAINRHAWESRDEGFAVEAFDPESIPVIESILGSHDWDAVRRTFEDFDPHQWADPPAGTETERVKERTIDVLVGDYGYSPASAELTSRYVLAEVAHRWD